jgi:hypothetical protein
MVNHFVVRKALSFERFHLLLFFVGLVVREPRFFFRVSEARAGVLISTSLRIRALDTSCQRFAGVGYRLLSQAGANSEVLHPVARQPASDLKLFYLLWEGIL